MLAVPLVKLANADNEHNTVRLEDLAGPWQAALVYSNTGCGPASGLVNFTLDSTATTHSATLTFHSGLGPNCWDAITNQTFTIQTLNPTGSGTANLSCGAGCGWEFNIQMDRHRSMFNMVDVDPANPGNFVAGTAVRHWRLIFSNGKYVFSRIAVAELPTTWGIVMSLGIAGSMVAISLLVAVARAADCLPVDPADLALTVPKIEKDADVEVMFWDVRVDDDPVWPGY